MVGFMDVLENVKKMKPGDPIRFPVSMAVLQNYKHFTDVVEGKTQETALDKGRI